MYIPPYDQQTLNGTWGQLPSSIPFAPPVVPRLRKGDRMLRPYGPGYTAIAINSLNSINPSWLTLGIATPPLPLSRGQEK